MIRETSSLPKTIWRSVKEIIMEEAQSTSNKPFVKALLISCGVCYEFESR